MSAATFFAFPVNRTRLPPRVSFSLSQLPPTLPHGSPPQSAHRKTVAACQATASNGIQNAAPARRMWVHSLQCGQEPGGTGGSPEGGVIAEAEL